MKPRINSRSEQEDLSSQLQAKVSEGAFIIREYHEADHDLVCALILSIIEIEYAGLSPSSYLADVHHFHTVYNGERDRFWVAEQDGKIIATIAVKEDDEDTALLRRFFVNPHCRSCGVGTKMYEQAVDFCKKKGYQKMIFIASDKMDKVNKFLKKRNFEEVENILLKKEEKHSYGMYKLARAL